MEGKNQRLTRREFLKGASVSGIGVSAMLLLVSCARAAPAPTPTERPEPKPTATTAPEKAYPAPTLPIGGVFTMGPKEAAYACKLIRPQYVIPQHFGTFPVLVQTVEDLHRWVGQYAPDTQVVELVPGEPMEMPPTSG